MGGGGMRQRKMCMHQERKEVEEETISHQSLNYTGKKPGGGAAQPLSWTVQDLGKSMLSRD